MLQPQHMEYVKEPDQIGHWTLTTLFMFHFVAIQQ